MPFDLSPCAQSTLTDLGHCAYTLRTCPQCAGAFAVCAECPSRGERCPGCRHRAVLAQIAAGEVVYPGLAGDHGERHDPTAVGGARADLAVDQARELAHVTDQGSGNAPAGVCDQAAMLDAGSPAVYAARVEPVECVEPVEPVEPVARALQENGTLYGVSTARRASQSVEKSDASGDTLYGSTGSTGGVEPDHPIPSDYDHDDDDDDAVYL